MLWLNAGLSAIACAFLSELLVVLDPLRMMFGADAMAIKHNDIVQLMDEAMRRCMEIYFQKEDIEEGGWAMEYISINGAESDM